MACITGRLPNIIGSSRYVCCASGVLAVGSAGGQHCMPLQMMWCLPCACKGIELPPEATCLNSDLLLFGLRRNYSGRAEAAARFKYTLTDERGVWYHEGPAWPCADLGFHRQLMLCMILSGWLADPPLAAGLSPLPAIGRPHSDPRGCFCARTCSCCPPWGAESYSICSLCCSSRCQMQPRQSTD